ncbi:MAG: hypothetical protein IKW03_02710 [Clostridia bacterium]|nr:hypothetical protein [Clostridia bacterium]
MDYIAYSNFINTICDDNDSVQVYLAINKIVSEHLDLAIKTFEINTKSFEDPLHQMEVVRVCLNECADKLFEDWKDRYFETEPPSSLIKNEIVYGPSFIQLTQVTSEYYKHEQNATIAYEIQAESEKRTAIKIASSQVNGLGFGIISNSIASHLIYMMQSEAAIKRQIKNAEAYIQKEKSIINSRRDNRIALSNRTYYSTKYIPQMTKTIEDCFSDVILCSIMALAKRNLINLDIVKNINYELSQDTLLQINSSENIESVIIKALEYCPYNVHAYAEARKHNISNDALQLAIMKYELNSAIDKEIAFSMLDDNNFEDAFAEIINNNHIDRNENEWQRIAQKHLDQSQEIITKHPDSFAGYGAVAIYLVAKNIESYDTTFWNDVQKNIYEFLNRFKQNNKSDKCFSVIVDNFKKYVIEYFDFSRDYTYDESGWDYAPEYKRWKRMTQDKRRLIPAIHCFSDFINELSKIGAPEIIISTLNNDLIWLLHIFCRAHFAADSAPTQGIIRKYYHLPLSERQFAIDMYDNLLQSSYANSEGKFTDVKKKNPKYIVEIYNSYKNEISDSGKEFFGIIKPNQNASNTHNEAKSRPAGCYIATYVYGSYDSPQVCVLRRYRDDVLAMSCLGKMFISLYYTISPLLVKYFGQTFWFKNLFKKSLDKIVEKLMVTGFSNENYIDKT